MFVNRKRVLLALYRMEEQQQEILAKLDRMEAPHPSSAATPSPQGEGLTRADEWVQQGIDNIMSFQAGRQREVDR